LLFKDELIDTFKCFTFFILLKHLDIQGKYMQRFLLFIFLSLVITAKDTQKETNQKSIKREVEIIRIKEEPDTKANQYLPKQLEENKLSQDSNTQSNAKEVEEKKDVEGLQAKETISDNKSKTIKLPEVSVEIFGFIKADYVYSNQAMLSFGRENLTAPNQAKRIVQNDDRDQRSLMSIRETSIGFKPKFGNNLHSVIQFDLMDINQGNGGPAGKPRIVQAYIEYKFGNKMDFFAGQKWDIFSPLYPDTYNIISGLLGSGNLGWFREQMGFKHYLSSQFNLSYSIGNSNLNTTPNVSPNVELTKAPTFAFQLEWIPTNQLNLYLSGIYSNLKYYDPNYSALYLNNNYSSSSSGFDDSYSQLLNNKKVSRVSSGISLSAQWKLASNLNIKGETHIGQNLDNFSTLTQSAVQVTSYGQSLLQSSSPLAYRSNFVDGGRTQYNSIREVGAWMSILYNITEHWEIIFLAGKTKILNPERLKTSFESVSGNQFYLKEMNQNQPNVNVWGSDQLGSVITNSTIGGSVARILEGNFKLFVYYQYTETEYKTSDRQKGIGRLISSIGNDGSISWNSANAAIPDSGNLPHAHLIRAGAMMNF
jgi:hypothetical protein